jgi:hypothetical protein
MEENDLMAQLEQFKNDYYSNNSKNILFKKSQKKDIAKHVSNNFNLEDLIKKTVFVIPETHHIMVDYSLFKNYAHDDNYTEIIRYSRTLIENVARNHQKFTIHAHIGSLTITSMERHRKFIEFINELYLNGDNGLSQYFMELYMYYPPSMIDSIFSFIRPFLDPAIISKMIVVSKTDSEQVYPKLLDSAYGR